MIVLLYLWYQIPDRRLKFCVGNIGINISVSAGSIIGVGIDIDCSFSILIQVSVYLQAPFWYVLSKHYHSIFIVMVILNKLVYRFQQSFNFGLEYQTQPEIIRKLSWEWYHIFLYIHKFCESVWLIPICHCIVATTEPKTYIQLCEPTVPVSLPIDGLFGYLTFIFL